MTIKDLKFRYFNGEDECPLEFKNSERHNFWTIEKYVHDHAELPYGHPPVGTMLDAWYEMFCDDEEMNKFEPESNGDWPNLTHFIHLAKPDHSREELVTAYCCRVCDDFSPAESYYSYFTSAR